MITLKAQQHGLPMHHVQERWCAQATRTVLALDAVKQYYVQTLVVPIKPEWDTSTISWFLTLTVPHNPLKKYWCSWANSSFVLLCKFFIRFAGRELKFQAILGNRKTLVPGNKEADKHLWGWGTSENFQCPWVIFTPSLWGQLCTVSGLKLRLPGQTTSMRPPI